MVIHTFAIQSISFRVVLSQVKSAVSFNLTHSINLISQSINEPTHSSFRPKMSSHPKLSSPVQSSPIQQVPCIQMLCRASRLKAPAVNTLLVVSDCFWKFNISKAIVPAKNNGAFQSTRGTRSQSTRIKESWAQPISQPQTFCPPPCPLRPKSPPQIPALCPDTVGRLYSIGPTASLRLYFLSST